MRLAAGVSLRELARRLQLSPATVSALETGHAAMTVDRLHEIATAMGVAPAELFAGASSLVCTRDRPGVDVGNWRDFSDLQMNVVLRAALTCIARYGYQGCSIRDIAEEAGMNPSSLYHYHPSKQAMLVALLDVTSADLLRRVRAARDEGDSGDPVGRFSRVVECLALYHSNRQELGVVAAGEMRSLEGESFAEFEGRRVVLLRMVETEVQVAVGLGLFTTDRPLAAARAVMDMCIAVAQWYNPSSDERPEDIASAYVRFALDLVAHRPR